MMVVAFLEKDNFIESTITYILIMIINIVLRLRSRYVLLVVMDALIGAKASSFSDTHITNCLECVLYFV